MAYCVPPIRNSGLSPLNKKKQVSEEQHWSVTSLFNRCKIFFAVQNEDASITQPNNPLADITLEQLPERLRAAAALAGWKALTPVQARSIPYVLAGRGMMIQARTG